MKGFVWFKELQKERRLSKEVPHLLDHVGALVLAFFKVFVHVDGQDRNVLQILKIHAEKEETRR